MFYQKAQFIVLTCIAVFLLILCVEMAHMERAVAQSDRDLIKVAICDNYNRDQCAQVVCPNRRLNLRNCYLSSEANQNF